MTVVAAVRPQEDGTCPGSGGRLTAAKQAWLEAVMVTDGPIHGVVSLWSPFHWRRSNNPAVKFLTQFSLLT